MRPAPDAAGAPRDDGASAKTSFSRIYDAPDPTPYFSALKPLDYRTPHHAQPVIRRAVDRLRRIRRRAELRVLDLCSGYGVNGALLKHDIALEDLYQRFDGHDGAASPTADRRALAPLRRRDGAVQVIGQDVAGRALDYGEAAGFLDESLCADLERAALTPRQAGMIADVDLVTITGGLSYVGRRTLARVLGAMRRRPWVLLFPLRDAPLGVIRATLERFGLRLERWPGPFAHRRFSDDRERGAVLRRFDGRPDDGLGPVSRTHLQAVLCVARPFEEIKASPLAELALGVRSDVGAWRPARQNRMIG